MTGIRKPYRIQVRMYNWRVWRHYTSYATKQERDEALAILEANRGNAPIQFRKVDPTSSAG